MKAIVCALDFSKTSPNVIKVAHGMAALKRTNLVVLFAYRLIQPDSQEITDYRNRMEERARTDFEAIVKKLKINGDVPYEFRTEIGFLSDRIEVYSKKNPVDMVVMCQHLAHSINNHRGLTFEDFLNSTKLPVLVVPDDYLLD